jgi:hypothetical protein
MWFPRYQPSWYGNPPPPTSFTSSKDSWIIGNEFSLFGDVAPGTLNIHFARRYERWTRRAVAKRLLELAILAEADGDLSQARRHLHRFLRTMPWGRAVKSDQWRVIARVFCPQTYRVARRLKGWLR